MSTRKLSTWNSFRGGLGILGCLLIAGAAFAGASPATPIVVYDSWNRDGALNDPTSLPVFSIPGPLKITGIWDYHWNWGAGQDPVAVGGTISLYDASSAWVGTWVASSWSGDAHIWFVNPDTVLQAGTYTIVDSDRSTWSYSTTDSFHLPGDGPNWGPGIGFSAVSAVPEPAGVVLLALGLAALAPRLFRRSVEPS